MLSKEIIDKSQQFAKLAVETLKTSVSPYNFVQTAKKLLNDNSFTQIYEGDEWKLEVGKKYYYTRNNSAIIAFTIGKKYDPTKSCFKIIGAHTDSPSLRLAPNSYNPSHGIERYNIQVYGGALWHTWLDRDLSIAGKVIYYNEKKELTCKVIKCNEPIFFIPNCPPHLQNADERSALKINKESHLKPLIATVLYNNGLAGEEKKNDEVKLGNTLRKVITDEINKNNPNPIKDIDIVDYDLVLYDTQEPNLIGLNKEFLASGRLDNMGSSVPAVYSIINASTEELLNEQTSINVISLFDNEEIGSMTFQGADSNFFYTHLKRLYYQTYDKASEDSFLAFCNRSFIISADLAHAFNPNYPEKYQSMHCNEVQKGVVVKINVQGRYSSDSESGAIFKEIGKLCNVPIQEFIVRQDSPCGTTIGPIITSKVGIRSVDVGIAQFAMHSIREYLGIVDLYYYKTIFEEFFKSYEKVKGNLTRE